MEATGKVIELRNLLAERFPQLQQPSRAHVVTGFSFLDQATGGGLPNGAITELISPEVSAGSASLIHALLQVAHRDRYFLALIDGRDSFDPSAWSGVDDAPLQNLLWVRCRKASEAIKAADLLLRDGNFPVVIVDLVLNAAGETQKIPQTSWYRLQRLVEVAPTACLVLTRQSVVGSAQLKIVLENFWTLKTLEEDNAISQLRIGAERSHLHQVSSGNAIAGAG